MFKSFIKYTFFFKESDSTKTSEQANNPNYISALMNAPQAFTRRCAVCPHSLLGKFKESNSIK